MAMPSTYLPDMEKNKFKESSATATQTAVCVINPDGSNINASTEFPAAALLADATALPTTTQVGAALEIYNGSTLDLAREIVTGANTTGTGVISTGLMAQFDDVTPQAITENRFGNLRMSTNRNLYMTIRDAAGNERGLNIDATGALAIGAIVPGTAQTSLGKAEDQAAVDGDVGVGHLAIRKAAPANTSGTDGDYEFLQMSAGRLWSWAMPETTASSPALSSVAVNAASTTLLASNAARRGVLIDNNATAIAYVRLSASAATTSIAGYNYQIPAGGSLTLPEPGQPLYTGQINVIWAAATGNGASVTEF